MPGKLDLLGDTVRRLISYGDSQPHYDEILRAVEAGSMPPSRQVLLPMPEQGWRVADQLGGDAYGSWQRAVSPRPAEPPFYVPHEDSGKRIASIVGMRAVPHTLAFQDGTDAMKRRGFLSSLLDTLQESGAEQVMIPIQSVDTRAAMTRLLNRGRVTPEPFPGRNHPYLFNLR
jgi:hypothetical protein